jgi:hypothetical protein
MIDDIEDHFLRGVLQRAITADGDEPKTPLGQQRMRQKDCRALVSVCKAVVLGNGFNERRRLSLNSTVMAGIRPRDRRLDQREVGDSLASAVLQCPLVGARADRG